MNLCVDVSEEGGDEEGSGSEELSLLSLDTHRREVSGVHELGTSSLVVFITSKQKKAKSRGNMSRFETVMSKETDKA